MLSILGFVLVLIPLVVVHELGHFLFAKLFKVRADAFSVGFGPVLLKRKWGETEFRLSAIPLGGYVKLLGEDPSVELPEEDRKRSLHAQKPWKRFFIFFGGPLFNFIWAAMVFMAMMAIGEPQISTVVGRVLHDSPAAKAGITAGDKIRAIDGTPVDKLEDLYTLLTDKASTEVELTLERQGKSVPVRFMTGSEEGFSVYGEKKNVGTIEGIIPSGRSTRIGISSPDSIAAKAGIKTGDEVVSIAGGPVKTFEELETAYAGLKPAPSAPLLLRIKSGEAEREVSLSGKWSGDLGVDFGIHSTELFIEQAVSGTPADKAGIKKMDQLIAVNGTPIRSFFELRRKIQKSGEDHGKVTVTVVRDGKTMTFEIIPQETTERDPLLKKLKQYTIGVMPMASMLEPVMVIERTLNPFKLLFKGTERMIDLSKKNIVSIYKMIMGQVSVKSLGGPILIGKLAGDSISRGLLDFLKMMAILSIGLGVLNILPIPVLDGGHIVLLGIEAVRGRALSLKQIEVVQSVGLAVILFIMIIVMKNDISRLPIFN
ncbi:MAG: RIP metalloprotease RseP [Bdellovibrionales bacterium]|nr:RIP metalloprotease RseP [Bdellovibrionales bacterium]